MIKTFFSVNNKTINFSYAVCTFTMKKKTKWLSKLKIKGSTKLENKTSFNLGSEQNIKLGFKSSAKINVNPITMQPILLVTDSSAIGSLFHNVGEEIVHVGSSVVDQDQERQEWYKQLDHFVFVEELVTSVLCDYTIVTHNNVSQNFQFKDPQMLKLCDVHRAHMYGGMKCTVTNNLSLLHCFSSEHLLHMATKVSVNDVIYIPLS